MRNMDGAIHFSGPDARTFLQGQLTHDLRLLTPHRPLLAAYCTPQGRVIAVLHLEEHADGIRALLPASLVDTTIAKLRKYVMRSKVTMAPAAGGDPDTNPRLRTIIAEAKSVNMPSDNIKKAIQRGTGELPGVSYEEVVYEGYGPGGAAVIIEVLTDNKNRTVGELRHMLTKHNGNLGESNSVAWMFAKKGYIVVDKAAASEEALLNAVLEAGGDDLRDDGDTWEILSEPSAFESVRDAVKALGVDLVSKYPLVPLGLRAIVVVGVIGAVIVHTVLRRLLAIVDTVRAGDPFILENARRLDAIAWSVLALEVLAPIAPGSPLCRATAPGTRFDGLEIALKGGQVGRDDYFGGVMRGAA